MIGVQIMNTLARVLLQMQTLNADADLLAILQIKIPYPHQMDF